MLEDCGVRVLRLTGVGRGSDVDVQETVAVDREWMHGVIATKRANPVHDRTAGPLRDNRAGRQRVAQTI